MIDNVKWEKNAGNESVIIHKSRLLKRSHATLKAIAVKKMTDISVISAEFGNYPKVFEQRLWVMIDKEISLEFFGIYTPVFPLENLPQEPVLCLRYAFWSQKNQSKQFQKNSHYEEYLLSDNQVNIYNVFLSHPESIKFSSLSDEIVNYVKSGLNFRFEETTNHLWSHIRLGIFDGDFELKLAYSPSLQKDILLEEMVIKLEDNFSLLDSHKGLIPEPGSHKLSYEKSVIELLSVYI